MESGEYSEAIRYLREIAPYNSDSIEKLKSWLNPYAFSLLAEHPMRRTNCLQRFSRLIPMQIPTFHICRIMSINVCKTTALNSQKV